MEQCSNCVYFHRLKKDFVVGVGFKESFCCDVLLHIDDGEEGWIQEVPVHGMCELYKGKEDA